MLRKNVWILVLGLLFAGGLQAAESAGSEAALRQVVDARSA